MYEDRHVEVQGMRALLRNAKAVDHALDDAGLFRDLGYLFHRLRLAVRREVYEGEEAGLVLGKAYMGQPYGGPKRSIARFFAPGATEAEIERRIVRALELLEQAEARRDRRGGA